jgi:Cu(I)/Ag(I) efflux system membrane protein CusA/SilA
MITRLIGGMLSSLIHILIVTPVLFAWLRERELRSPVGINRARPVFYPATGPTTTGCG